MTICKVSYKNLVSKNTELYHPIIIPNKNCNVNFLHRASIFLQRLDGSNVYGKVKLYTVTGYFLGYNDESKDVSGIKFTERKFLTQLTQEKIQKKLRRSRSIEVIVELNDKYEIINPKINKNDYIQPENGILTLEQFLFNLEGPTFSKLRNAHIEATHKGLVEYISPFLRH